MRSPLRERCDRQGPLDASLQSIMRLTMRQLQGVRANIFGPANFQQRKGYDGDCASKRAVLSDHLPSCPFKTTSCDEVQISLKTCRYHTFISNRICSKAQSCRTMKKNIVSRELLITSKPISKGLAVSKWDCEVYRGLEPLAPLSIK